MFIYFFSFVRVENLLSVMAVQHQTLQREIYEFQVYSFSAGDKWYWEIQ